MLAGSAMEVDEKLTVFVEGTDKNTYESTFNGTKWAAWKPYITALA
jgi:hypothetical protein